MHFANIIRTGCISVFLLLSVQAQAQIFSITKGKVDFRSDAPLELITASSKDLKGKIDVEKRQFAFSVKMNSFMGFNSPLQREHFNENYVESDVFPDASFAGKIIEEVNLAADGTYEIRAKGKFTIHGVTQDRIIKSTVVVKNGMIRLDAAFTVLLADHNIPVPKVVHEKLASEIKVNVTAELKQ